ncbi:MAG: hypothetical protein ABIO70_12315 [Pseudomonadota bacterium]
MQLAALLLLGTSAAALGPVRATPMASGEQLVCWDNWSGSREHRVLVGPAGATAREDFELLAELPREQRCWWGRPPEGVLAVATLDHQGKEHSFAVALRSSLALETRYPWRDAPPYGLRRIWHGPEGSTWATGEGLLTRFDPATERWQHIRPADGGLKGTPRIEGISDEGLLMLYGGGETGMCYDPERELWLPESPDRSPPDHLHPVGQAAQAPDGRRWFYDGRQLWTRAPGDGWEELPQGPVRSSGLSPLPAGVLIVGDPIPWRFELSSGQWRVLAALDRDNIQIDAQGRAWLRLGAGLQAVELEWADPHQEITRQTARLVGEPLSPAGPVEPRFVDLASDADGRLWLISNLGVHRYDPGDGSWWTDAAPRQLQSIGQPRADPAGGLFVHDHLGPVHLGGPDTPVQRYHPPGHQVRFVGRDSLGRPWFDADHTLLRYDAVQTRWISEDEDGLGVLWAGLDGKPFAAAQRGCIPLLGLPGEPSASLPPILPDGTRLAVLATAVDTGGRAWLGTDRGVYRQDGTGGWEHVSGEAPVAGLLLHGVALLASWGTEGRPLLYAVTLASDGKKLPSTIAPVVLPDGALLLFTPEGPQRCDAGGACATWEGAADAPTGLSGWKLGVYQDGEALWFDDDGERLFRWTAAEGWQLRWRSPAAKDHPTLLGWDEGPWLSGPGSELLQFLPDSGAWRLHPRAALPPALVQAVAPEPRRPRDSLELPAGLDPAEERWWHLAPTLAHIGEDGSTWVAVRDQLMGFTAARDAWCCESGWNDMFFYRTWADPGYDADINGLLWRPNGGQDEHGPSGGLWVLTADALWRKDVPGDRQAWDYWEAFQRNNEPPPPVSDGRGGRWRVTEEGLLHERGWRCRRAVLLPGIPRPVIDHLQRDPDTGLLWLGLRGVGLVAWDPQEERAERFGIGLDPNAGWRPWMAGGVPTGSFERLWLERGRVFVEQDGRVYSLPAVMGPEG